MSVVNTDDGGTTAQGVAAEECAVCLQKFELPVRLPCLHEFCYLCVKGTVMYKKACPLCRRRVSTSFLDTPLLVEAAEKAKTSCWFYEGRNGWWSYDARSTTELESRFSAGDENIEMVVAGAMYVVDFEEMVQYRKADPRRRRKIKRESVEPPDTKGIAGVHRSLLPGTFPHTSSDTDLETRMKRLELDADGEEDPSAQPQTTSQSPPQLPSISHTNERAPSDDFPPDGAS